MDIIKYRQVKHRVRKGDSFTADEVKQLVDIIEQYRAFVTNLMAYSSTGHSVLINSVYDMRNEATRLKEMIEGMPK